MAKETADPKKSTDLCEREIVLTPPPDRNKIRESEIANEDISIFKVPEVLYAKDPLLIDTIEKFRNESENL